MVYVVLVCFAAPLVLLLPLLTGSARRIVAFTLVGAVVATSAAEINGALYGTLGLEAEQVSLDAAPIVEEVMKAVPVLLFALFASDRREDVLPVAMATGIGFAILENSYLLVSQLVLGGASSVSLSWALVRGLSTSLSHGICTAAVGYGITYVHRRRKLFYTGTFALLTSAITFHATFNLLVRATSPLDWAGLAMPMAAYLGYYALTRLRRTPAIP